MLKNKNIQLLTLANFILSAFTYYLFVYQGFIIYILEGATKDNGLAYDFLAWSFIFETIIYVPIVLTVNFVADIGVFLAIVIWSISTLFRSYILSLFNISITKTNSSKKVLIAVLLLPYFIQLASIAFVYISPDYKNMLIEHKKTAEYIKTETAKYEKEGFESAANYVFVNYIYSDGCNAQNISTNDEMKIDVDRCTRDQIKYYLDKMYQNKTGSEENIFTNFFDRCEQIKDIVRQNKCFDGLFLSKKYHDNDTGIVFEYEYLPNENDSAFIKKLLESKESYCSFAYKNIKEKVNTCVKRLP